MNRPPERSAPNPPRECSAPKPPRECGVKKGAVFEAAFTDVTNEGFGVCRAPDCRAVFVPRALPGERASVKVVREYKTYLIGRVERLLAASESRVEADCPAYKTCGGCCWRHVAYEAELKFKRKAFCDTFRRVTGFEIQVPEPIHGSPDAYRNKLTLPVAEDGGRLVCGFYARHSHRVVPCAACRLHGEDFALISERLLSLLRGLPAYDEASGSGLVRRLYLRRTQGGEFGVCVVINGDRLPRGEAIAAELMGEFPQIRSFCANVNKGQTNAVVGKEWRLIAGDAVLRDSLCGREFVLSPASFFQVNRGMAQALYAKAASFAGIGEGDTVFDLYCGVGAVGLCVCPKGAALCGVEIVPQAVENARRNAALNGRSEANTRYVCGDAAKGFAECERAFGRKADVVLLDPPRSGLEKGLPERIAEQNPRAVVYISCNPATFARDAAAFAKAGYAIKSAALVDMFPRTSHIETVALLQKET